MGQQWVTKAVACQVNGISERTLRRWITEGKIQSKHEGKRLFVLVDTADIGAVNIGQSADIQADTTMIDQIQRENELLREQLKEKDKQIGKLQEEISEHSQRTDSIIMQLTRQLGDVQKALKISKAPWWKRLGKGKDENKA
jgi:septal ring factor EnvC (AmiA/AmiB activator)